MMYYWIGILLTWFGLLCMMAKRIDAVRQKNETAQQCSNIDQYMHANPHITDERRLVDALKDEDIVYRGCER